MKSTLIFLFLIIGLTACQNTEGPSVSFEDPSIDMLKTMVENYEKGDLDANLAYYSDTAKIFPKGYGLPSITAKEDLKLSKEGLSQFSEYAISDEIYEVVTLDGTKWLHFWGLWTGKLVADGSEVKVPFFMNPAVKDGKIIMMSFYSDGSIIADAIKKATPSPPIAEDNEDSSEATE